MGRVLPVAFLSARLRFAVFRTERYVLNRSGRALLSNGLRRMKVVVMLWEHWHIFSTRRLQIGSGGAPPETAGLPTRAFNNSLLAAARVSPFTAHIKGNTPRDLFGTPCLLSLLREWYKCEVIRYHIWRYLNPIRTKKLRITGKINSLGYLSTDWIQSSSRRCRRPIEAWCLQAPRPFCCHYCRCGTDEHH